MYYEFVCLDFCPVEKNYHSIKSDLIFDVYNRILSFFLKYLISFSDITITVINRVSINFEIRPQKILL